MILWSKATAANLQGSIESVLRAALEKGGAWRIFMIPFIQVVREGIETVVFIAGTTTSRDFTWKAIPIPGILGIITAIGVAYVLLKGTLKLNVKLFFDITSFILMAFAAGLLSLGLNNLQFVGLFGYYAGDLEEENWEFEISKVDQW
jgi:high-affinity iron transporter